MLAVIVTLLNTPSPYGVKSNAYMTLWKTNQRPQPKKRHPAHQ